jgi:hypothetical protein
VGLISYFLDQGLSLDYIQGLANLTLDFDESWQYFTAEVSDLSGGYYTPRLPALEIQASMR